MLPELTDAEALRYNRQIVLRGFDFDGEKLKAARVLIAGLGGLGCAAARRRPASAIWYWWISTPSRSPTCSARSCTATIASARAKSPPPQELSAINPHIRIDAIDGRLEDEAVAARSPPAIWCWTAPTTWRRATP